MSPETKSVLTGIGVFILAFGASFCTALAVSWMFDSLLNSTKWFLVYGAVVIVSSIWVSIMSTKKLFFLLEQYYHPIPAVISGYTGFLAGLISFMSYLYFTTSIG